MSNFYCHECQKPIIDSPGKGYITGCKHFPMGKGTQNKETKKQEIPDFLKDLFNI